MSLILRLAHLTPDSSHEQNLFVSVGGWLKWAFLASLEYPVSVGERKYLLNCS